MDWFDDCASLPECCTVPFGCWDLSTSLAVLLPTLGCFLAPVASFETGSLAAACLLDSPFFCEACFTSLAFTGVEVSSRDSTFMGGESFFRRSVCKRGVPVDESALSPRGAELGVGVDFLTGPPEVDLVLLTSLPRGAVDAGEGFFREEAASGGWGCSFFDGLPKVELQKELPLPHVEENESDDCWVGRAPGVVYRVWTRLWNWDRPQKSCCYRHWLWCWWVYWRQLLCTCKKKTFISIVLKNPLHVAVPGRKRTLFRHVVFDHIAALEMQCL